MIITISRQFGSGGRELGHALARELSIPCFDKEIISLIAEKQDLSEDYIAMMSEKNIQTVYYNSIGNRFAMFTDPTWQNAINIMVDQQKIIRDIAEKGSCIIIGRCADVVLKDMNPYSIFVYADTASRLARCRARAPKGEELSDKDLIKQMKRIDKERASYRSNYTDAKWADMANYSLCLNTSHIDIEAITPAVASLIKASI